MEYYMRVLFYLYYLLSLSWIVLDQEGIFDRELYFSHCGFADYHVNVIRPYRTPDSLLTHT